VSKRKCRVFPPIVTSTMMLEPVRVSATDVVCPEMEGTEIGIKNLPPTTAIASQASHSYFLAVGGNTPFSRRYIAASA